MSDKQQPTTAPERELTREISIYLTRVIQAKCTNCRKRETAEPDIMKRAVELFTQRGWRVRGIRLLCKECADE